MLATIRTPHGTRAVVLAHGRLVDLGVADLDAFFADPDWPSAATTADAAGAASFPVASARSPPS